MKLIKDKDIEVRGGNGLCRSIAKYRSGSLKMINEALKNNI